MGTDLIFLEYNEMLTEMHYVHWSDIRDLGALAFSGIYEAAHKVMVF